MLAFSNDYYGMIFRATQSVELFCAYDTLDFEEITNQTRVFLDLGIDSLTMMEIICVIENIYNIFFSEEQLSFDENLTIGELIEIINKQLKN